MSFPLKAIKISKVLVIGSGPIIIGQAADFDYAGAEASKGSRGSLEHRLQAWLELMLQPTLIKEGES